MTGERDYLKTVEDGRRNQEVKVLIQNWCGHARIEKFGGTGLIEAYTGFPIGHHSMACDHAPMGGSATWNLEHAALEFYDRNCITCKVRLPLRMPNLLELVQRRDREVALSAAKQASEAKRLRDEYDARQKTRAALQANASAPVAALLEDLQQLDQTGDQPLAEKIAETARLAPEVFNADIVEHLFRLIEAGETWATQTALNCLRIVSTDHKRLVACAMHCLAHGQATPTAAIIAHEHVDAIDESQVEASVRSLCFLAAPPRDFHHFAEPEQHPEALQALAAKFPASVERALDRLLASISATSVKAAARAVALVYSSSAYPLMLVRSLAAKLTRADSMIDSDRDSEVNEVVHELGRALVHAMLADAQQVDAVLTSYYQGASSDGEARIAGIYSSMLRRPGNRFESVTSIPDSKPYATALRRVLTLASSTNNPKVIDEVREALQHFPDQLADVAREEMEFLLGAAVLVDQAYADFDSSPAPPETPDNFLAHLDRSSHKQRLYSLRAAILEWASHAAAADAAAAGKFFSFVSSNAQWPEQFRSALVQALPPLMDTAASTNAILPFLYGAMVGESALVRMAAARALGKLHSSRVRDLPSLVHDAFLLLLSDPIIGVHQSAAEALERISLPAEYDDRIDHLLVVLFNAYIQDRARDEFLVTCIDLLVSRRHKEDRFAGGLARIIVAVLMKVDEMTLLRHGRSWMLKRLANVEGFPALLLKLLRSAESNEHYDDEFISLLRELAQEDVLGIREDLVALCQDMPRDRVLVAASIEVLSAAGAWDAAADVAAHSHEGLPDSTRMRMPKRLARMTVLAAEFERLLADGRHVEALGCATQWREVQNEMERDWSTE